MISSPPRPMLGLLTESQVQTPRCALCPSPWFLSSSQETPLEGSLGSWALVADTWYPLQNALSPALQTDPLQMQDYGGATGNESPIAPVWANNANSHHARQKQCTCCDTFVSLSYGRCTYNAGLLSEFLSSIHTVQGSCLRLIAHLYRLQSLYAYWWIKD